MEDVCGDPEKLVGAVLLQAEEVSNSERDESNCESRTWTFYKLATFRGYVTIRWLGTSNGYYSESVSFAEIREGSDEE